MSLSGFGLGMMRRGLGLLCLLDALMRLTQATLMYSDLGLLPRDGLYRFFEESYALSLYMLSGQPFFAGLLLVLTALLAGLNLAGRSRRWSRVLLWALVMSVQVRNPVLVDGADHLLRLLLFWDIFLPETSTDKPVKNWASLALQCQLSMTFALVAYHHHTAQDWSLAAQWGNHPWALGVPWLGQLIAGGLLVGVSAVWWGAARKWLVWPLLALMGAWGAVMDPSFPLTVAVALLALLEKGPLEEQGRLPWSGRRQKTLAGLAGLATVIGLAWSLGLASQLPPLKLLGQATGLNQDWTQLYPLGSSQRHRLEIEASQRRFLLPEDRRSRLFVEAAIADPRLLEAAVKALLRPSQFEGQASVWQRTDRLTPELQVLRGQPRLIQETTVEIFRRPQ